MRYRNYLLIHQIFITYYVPRPVLRSLDMPSWHSILRRCNWSRTGETGQQTYVRWKVKSINRGKCTLQLFGQLWLEKASLVKYSKKK